MPFLRISLLKGKSSAYLAVLSDSVQRALVEAFEAPAADRFQVLHQCEPEELVFDWHYLGGPRSDDFVLICITAGRQRSNRVKQAFYRRLADLLTAKPGIEPRDVMVIITVTETESWSFGDGIAATRILADEKEAS